MSIASPQELFSDPTLRREFTYNWNTKAPLDAVLESAEAVLQEPDIVQTLDDLHDSDPDTWYDVNSVICALDPETIFINYGEEVLAWVAANSGTMSIESKMQSGLERLVGYDKESFMKAKLWCWHNHNGTKGKDVLSQYALIDNLLRSDALGSIDLGAQLQKAANDGITISQQRVKDYALEPISTPDTEPMGYIRESWVEIAPNTFYEVYLDAPVGFMLRYKGRPQAVAGGEIKDGKELLIHQLQGIRGKLIDPTTVYPDNSIIKRLPARGLMPLDWQKLMVNISANLARNMGLPSVGLRTGSKNYWATHILKNETEPHLSPEAAYNAYDAPARRLGFIKGDDGDWHKAI